MSRPSEHPTVKRHREKAVSDAAEPATVDAAWLRDVAIAAGADDVGFVEVERARSPGAASRLLKNPHVSDFARKAAREGFSAAC